MRKVRLLALSCWLLASCANIVTPTGGPKDEQPPKITGENPKNFSTRFTGNIIEIEFDEYVQLNNPTQEIVISPAIEPGPEFSVKGKKLLVKIKAVLDSATTYTIAFGEALKDANEGNVLSGLKYVFSTGEQLDSLSVTGRVLFAKDDTPADKTLVMLYKETSDSVVFRKKPHYFAKTNKEGRFSLENIRAGEYKLFALKDENFNYLYDLPNEEIAFMNSTVHVDSAVAPVVLSLFKENRSREITVLSREEQGRECLKLVLSGKAENAELSEINSNISSSITEYNATRDSLCIWFTHPWKTDTARLVVNNEIIDTFKLRGIPGVFDTLQNKLNKLVLITGRAAVHPAGKLSVFLNRPVKGCEFATVRVEQDSPKIDIKYNYIQFTDSIQRKIEIDFPRKEGTTYTVYFPPGACADYFGTTNDSLVWKITTKRQEDYASLKLSVSGEENMRYILRLLGANESVAVEKSFTGSAVFHFDTLLPGTYQPLIIFDENKNKKWDTGDYALHLQPEKTYRHPEQIKLRANWEVEVDLKLAGAE